MHSAVLRVRLALIALLGLIMFHPASDATASPVRIGVLAHKGLEQCMESWSATASYLATTIPGYDFATVCLPFDRVDPAIRDGAIDFIIANSSIYVELEIKYGVSRIATMQNLALGKGYTVFGGVIFTRADRADIQQLKDLRGKRFMAADRTSLGGWRMAWRELKGQGIDPERDFSSLQFGGTHNQVVFAVRDDLVDAGTVRTDTLERMAAEERISLSDFKVIPYRGRGEEYGQFPFLLSTPLYPEWPIAKLKHTPEGLAKKVTSSLLNMPKDSPASRAAQIEGWTIPLNYQSVDGLLRDLRIGPYRDLGRVTPGDVFHEYWPSLAGIALGLCGLVALTLYVTGLNRSLKMSRQQLQSELQERRRAEEALLESDERLRLQLAEIQSLQATLQEEAIRDGLTGLFNRRYLDETLERELARSKREGVPVSVVMLDIDHFKQLNDTFGHKAGDRVLQTIGEMLRDQTRREDIACRYGGEEFVVIMPGAAADTAGRRAEEWRVAFESLRVDFGGMSLRVTLSAGVASFPQHGGSGDELIKRADDALYRAKAAGRNSVVIAAYPT